MYLKILFLRDGKTSRFCSSICLILKNPSRTSSPPLLRVLISYLIGNSFCYQPVKVASAIYSMSDNIQVKSGNNRGGECHPIPFFMVQVSDNYLLIRMVISSWSSNHYHPCWHDHTLPGGRFSGPSSKRWKLHSHIPCNWDWCWLLSSCWKMCKINYCSCDRLYLSSLTPSWAALTLCRSFRKAALLQKMSMSP